MSVKHILLIFFLIIIPCSVQAEMYLRGEDTRTLPPEQLWGERKSWGLDFDLGGQYYKGNVDMTYLAVTSGAFKKFDRHSFYVHGNSIFQKWSGQTIFNQMQGIFRYDFSLTDKFKLFAFSTHGHNKFTRLHYRTSNGIGPWYDFFYKNIKNGVSIAPTQNSEWYISNGKDHYLSLSFRNLFELALSKHVKIGSDIFVMPRLTRWEDLQFYGSAYIQTLIYKDLLSLKLSFVDEYDTNPQPGIEKNDMHIATSLMFHVGK
ncbi:MAG: DUF481 domain-containing protein [Deltaproteobacteria bacterium]|nr:DUF481 domain-containing protein [Deltaproteobacteria bacterium]